MFGLIEQDIHYIKEALGSLEEVEKAVIFGSRAMGNYKKGSDVDVALIGSGITSETVFRINDQLNEEYPLPYFFDVVAFNELQNEKLKEHIINEGKEIYSKPD